MRSHAGRLGKAMSDTDRADERSHGQPALLLPRLRRQAAHRARRQSQTSRLRWAPDGVIPLPRGPQSHGSVPGGSRHRQALNSSRSRRRLDSRPDRKSPLVARYAAVASFLPVHQRPRQRESLPCTGARIETHLCRFRLVPLRGRSHARGRGLKLVRWRRPSGGSVLSVAGQLVQS